MTPSDQVTLHGAVPVSAAETVVPLPAQTCAVPDTVAVGNARTTAVVVAAGETQLATVTVTLYVPAAASVAPGIAGFCSDEANPFGPVQL